MSFSPKKYVCPTCNIRIPEGKRRKRLGPYVAHPDCRVECDLCGAEITPPAFGRGFLDVVAYNGRPVHAVCKP